MSLPGDGTAHATTAKKERLAVEAGVAVMALLEQGLTPSKIMTESALENMLRVNMAIGGSLNTVLHIPAIAHELGRTLRWDRFDSISRETPHLCSIEPSGPATLAELEDAGGIPAVMQRLGSKLDLDCVTVTGRTVGENVADAEVFDEEVIRSVDAPVHPYGGIAVLEGSLAPAGAVIKQVAVDESLWKFEGPAKVFDSEEEATRSRLRQGDRGRGCRGDPLRGPQGRPRHARDADVQGPAEVRRTRQPGLSDHRRPVLRVYRRRLHRLPLAGGGRGRPARADSRRRHHRDRRRGAKTRREAQRRGAGSSAPRSGSVRRPGSPRDTWPAMRSARLPPPRGRSFDRFEGRWETGTGSGCRCRWPSRATQ